MKRYRTVANVVVGAALVLWVCACSGASQGAGVTGSTRLPAAGAIQTGTGSCATSFTSATLAARSWAFDGTLTRTATGHDSHLGPIPVATFRVKHWFKGGSAATATVEWDAISTGEGADLGGGRGSRHLVSGEPRWGGKALSDPVAWGCGFTQRWSLDAAHAWKAAFGE